jgi:fumarylacetoacetate (FAA) hydrolase
MKLGTLKCQGERDGILVVVSKDLTKAVEVPDIAYNLQEALDDWEEVAPTLRETYARLNAGELDDEAQPFNAGEMHSPLPRAYQWADGSAYVNHVELVRKARGAEMPESFWTDPLMYQGGSDSFIAPTDPIELANTEWGCDFESEIAVITGDVPMGCSPEEALKHIRLIMLVNDVSLRNLIPNELAKGFGFFQSKPASAFSPVAVTPEELGAAWKGGKVNLPLISTLNGKEFGRPNAGVDMTFHFGQLIAHVAKTRHLSAGSIIGSGTVSNVDRSTGSSCLAEKRMIETIENGKPVTPFMQFGDTIRVEMLDAKGKSIFGAIDQSVMEYKAAKKAA